MFDPRAVKTIAGETWRVQTYWCEVEGTGWVLHVWSEEDDNSGAWGWEVLHALDPEHGGPDASPECRANYHNKKTTREGFATMEEAAAAGVAWAREFTLHPKKTASDDNVEGYVPVAGLFFKPTHYEAFDPMSGRRLTVDYVEEMGWSWSVKIDEDEAAYDDWLEVDTHGMKTKEDAMRAAVSFARAHPRTNKDVP